MEPLKRRLLILKDNNNRRRASSVSLIHKSKQKCNYNNKNLKQIFILSFDALKERRARSALTILMVIVGGGLMIAINGMSAGQSAFVNKQLNTLAPDIMFVSSGQHGFRGPSGPPTIIFNTLSNRDLESILDELERKVKYIYLQEFAKNDLINEQTKRQHVNRTR